MTTKISVIIPNLNSPVIDQTISALRCQTIGKEFFDVIVVGQDKPGLVVQDHLVHLDVTERAYTPAEARNRGAYQATGEIIAFLDSDCVPNPNWLKTLLDCFRKKEIDAVGGGIQFEKKPYWKFADNLSNFYEFFVTQPPGYRIQFPSLNYAIRREVFKKVGGFDEGYPKPAGEDFDFTLRVSIAGYKQWFEPSAWVLHSPVRDSLRELWNHAILMGTYSTKLDPRYRKIVGLPSWLLDKKRLLGLSPLLALLTALRLYYLTPGSVKYIIAFPAIFISKFAWILGAANSPYLNLSLQDKSQDKGE